MKVAKWCIVLYGFMLPIYGVNCKCRGIAQQVEQELNIPNYLLQAIVLTESSDQPWVLGVLNQPYRYKNKKGVLQKLKELIGEGATNIDIGCSQLNYYYHAKNFNTLSEMIDPYKNIRYAGQLLTNLYKETGSWDKAVAFYHSRINARYTSYTRKVKTAALNIKNKIRQDAHVKHILNDLKKANQSGVRQQKSRLNKAKIAYVEYKKKVHREKA